MLSDIRFALRSLAKTPGFSSIAILTVALGIGLNTSMFSVLHALVLRPLPYPDSDALVRVYRTVPGVQDNLPLAPPNYFDLRAATKTLAHVAAGSVNAYSLAEPGQPAVRLFGMVVTDNFLSALALRPAVGRDFLPDDFTPGRERVALLTHAAWLMRFGSDPSLVNRTVRLDGEAYTIIGILPAGFDDTRAWGPIELLTPFAPGDELRANRSANFLTVFGRLAPGAALEQAQAELSTISAQLAQAFPATNGNSGLRLVPLHLSVQDSTARTLSWFTFGLAGCVLLIACANLANLLFARNALRTREQAVRAALGATRFHLIRQSLSESLVLATAGGVLGLLFAVWANDALSSRLLVNGNLPLRLPTDYATLAFAFGLAAISGLVFGLLPAFLAARTDLNEALKQGARGSSGGPALHRLRRILIVAEVALALTLLAGAGFFIDSLLRFADRDLGWRPERVLSGSLTLSTSRYDSPEAIRAFSNQLEERLRSTPGIERVGLTSSLPFNSYSWLQRYLVEGRPDPAPGTEPMRAVNLVSLDFFAATGLELVEGRTFTPADVTGTVTPIVISETMARQVWPDRSALGQRIAHPLRRTEWQEVIGVVRDVRFANDFTNAQTRIQTYRLMTREPDRRIGLVLRTSLDPASLADSVRRVVTELDADLPVHNLMPAEGAITRGRTNFTALAALLAGFATLGLFLAALGLYGLISSFVAQRHREIGVRLALGATTAGVVRMVLHQGLSLAGLGVAFGFGGTLAVSRILGAILPVFPAPQWSVAAGITVTLFAVSALACWLPARRATRVDPMIALRSE
jgi:putative ABC transport system permease protein